MRPHRPAGILRPAADSRTTVGFPSIEAQVQCLSALLPGIELRPVPDWASAHEPAPGYDGHVLIPTWGALCRHFGCRRTADPEPELLGRTLALLGQRTLKAREVASGCLRTAPEAIPLLVAYEDEAARNGSEALLVSLSLGSPTATCPPRAVRSAALVNGCLPLTATQASWALHLLSAGSAWATQGVPVLDCCGSEYCWGWDGRWAYCPSFVDNGGKAWLSAEYQDTASPLRGSAIGYMSVPGHAQPKLTSPPVPLPAA